MKLSDLGAALDPRRPLYYDDTVADTGAPTPARALLGKDDDLRSVDALIARLVAHPMTGVADTAPARVTDPTALAAESVRLFTGAGAGLLAAVWHDRSAAVETRLRSALTVARTELVAHRVAAESGGPVGELGDASAAARLAWGALTDFDALHRAFSGPVLTLSPGAAAALAAVPATPARAATALAGRARWGDGVLWRPTGLLAWHGDAGGVRLATLPAAAVPGWIDGPTDALPAWSHLRLPDATRPTDIPAGWRDDVVLIDRLTALGSHRPAPGPAAAIPVTRFVMTTAEGRTGVDPVDLTTGRAPADPDWDRAHHRETYAAAQGRRVRVFVDAARPGRRPPSGPVLVTVLPR